MPIWYYPDGRKHVVSGEKYERLQEEEYIAFESILADTRARLHAEWLVQFGDNLKLPFNPNSKEVFAEAERVFRGE